MSATFLMVATVALISIGGISTSVEPNSITSEQVKVSGGFDVDGKCRKVEEAFHEGNGPVITRGNKHISRVEAPGGRHIVETTTFCVEV